MTGGNSGIGNQLRVFNSRATVLKPKRVNVGRKGEKCQKDGSANSAGAEDGCGTTYEEKTQGCEGYFVCCGVKKKAGKDETKQIGALRKIERAELGSDFGRYSTQSDWQSETRNDNRAEERHAANCTLYSARRCTLLLHTAHCTLHTAAR
jgi:hypothetical protein